MGENNLTLVKPEANPAIVAFYEQAVSLKDFAVSRVIATNDDLLPATNDLSLISQVMKGMESCRKEYLRPFQDHIKETNDAYKMLMEPIQQADKITRDKMTAFINEQTRKRREAEAIEAEKLALARREMELKGGVTVNLAPVEKPDAPPDRIRTDMGSAGLTQIKKWEVEDLSKVPLDYLMIDATKVGKVVRAGIPSIPGIRIWSEDSLRITAK